MPLFLAGLLVRGGALAPETAEEALQRQALLGGALDTSLLELGCIEEDTLVPYLSRASGLPPIPAGALDGALDRSLREAVTRGAAERFGVVPFAWDGGTLHVACCHPAESTPLHELAPAAARVEGYVAPEFRVRLAIARLHGTPAATRFHELAARLMGGSEADVSTARTRGEPGWQGPGHVDGSESGIRTAGRSAPGELGLPSREEAFSLLGSAADRDDALAVLLRFARQHFELAAALAVSGKSLVGWDALGPGPDAAARIKQLSFPLEEASVLRLVAESGSPYLGPIGERDCVRDLEAALGRQTPHVALVVPITVATRTVALLFAENGDRPISPTHVEPVLHVAQAVGPALEKLIRARKAGRAAPGARGPARAANGTTSAGPARRTVASATMTSTAPPPAPTAPLESAARPASEAALASAAAPASAAASASGAEQGAPDLRLPKIERRRSEPDDSPIEPARRAVERALAARTAAELDAALPALREVSGLAAQMLVALLPVDPPSISEGSSRVARVLERLGAPAIPALARAAVSPARGVRLQAARLASGMEGGEATALLAALSTDEDPEVAAEAREGPAGTTQACERGEHSLARRDAERAAGGSGATSPERAQP